MKIGIMQPYLFPYLGYYQLINAVDTFVIYDNIQYIKGGWINRNRLLLNGQIQMFTIPIAKASNYLNINERYISSDINGKKNINKILFSIENSYKKAPFFNDIFPLIEEIFNFNNNNLFEYLHFSLIKILDYMKIKTPINISSEININHSLKHQNKVLSICKKLNATDYINSIGGVTLYDYKKFKSNGFELSFLKTLINLKVNSSSLSIIDILMNNSITDVNNMLNQYEIIKND